jgi:hypothetical protein
LLGNPYQFAILAQRTQHIHPLLVRLRLDAARLPDAGPSVLHWGIRTETRFIEEQQFALPGQCSLTQ